MSEDLTRCPNCSGAVPTLRPVRCQWCGTPLPAAPTIAERGSVLLPSRGPDVLGLPRELAPLPAPRSSAFGKFLFTVFLFIAALFALSFVVFSVRGRPLDAPPPSPTSHR